MWVHVDNRITHDDQHLYDHAWQLMRFEEINKLCNKAHRLRLDAVEQGWGESVEQFAHKAWQALNTRRGAMAMELNITLC